MTQQVTQDMTTDTRPRASRSQVVFVTEPDVCVKRRDWIVQAAHDAFGEAPSRFGIVTAPDLGRTGQDLAPLDWLADEVRIALRRSGTSRVLVTARGRSGSVIATHLAKHLVHATVAHRAVTPPERRIDALVVIGTDQRLHACPTALGKFARIAGTGDYGLLALPGGPEELGERVTSGMIGSMIIGEAIQGGLRKIALVGSVARASRNGTAPAAHRRALEGSVERLHAIRAAVRLSFPELDVRTGIAVLNDVRCKRLLTID